jgi:hypothetical protein
MGGFLPLIIFLSLLLTQQKIHMREVYMVDKLICNVASYIDVYYYITQTSRQD